MEISTVTCELENYCIFQNVIPGLIYCSRYRSPCSSDAADSREDGTFICNYHLGKYFKIIKSRFEIPSGSTTDNRSFKMLIGQHLLPQNESSRTLIPVSLEAGFNLTTMNSMEKFVFYSIYEREEDARVLCNELLRQEYQEDNLWRNFFTTVTMILGFVQPNALCRPMLPHPSTRVYNSQAIFDIFPPFLKNLITRLVRPTILTIGTHTLRLNDVDTCMFRTDGLMAPGLHNPNKPVLPENYTAEPRFSMRTVVEFDGRATKEQRVLDQYENFVITRPLLNGTETV